MIGTVPGLATGPNHPPSFQSVQLSPLRACTCAFLFALGLAGLALLNNVRQSESLLWSFLGAAGALLVWAAALFGAAARVGRRFRLDIVLRKQHYLQACAQGSVLLYWGWFARDVYAATPLIGAQLVFAYGVEMLLTWSRGDTYRLGFAPFPVVFSINLFLWFRPEWFHLQFLMVAFGFAAKEMIHWHNEGRSTHIFNPSAFTLALFSIALLLTGRSDITSGQTIAITQFYPPHMYLMLFLIGLPGQLLFGVTSMTMAAVVTTYLFGLLYFAATGVYFFYDSYIPIAVFLGMHLLFTDPSTSPRTELGRLIFGALYGLSTIFLYYLLGRAGLPTFYDKLLQVPLLNLSIKSIDRAARSDALRRFDPAALGRSLSPIRRNLVYVSVWIIAFSMMSAAQGVGDHHPGQWLPFWRKACTERRRGACDFLAARLSTHCAGGSGWACNEGGIVRLRLSESIEDGEQAALADAMGSLERGCALGFKPACQNVLAMLEGNRLPESAPPTLEDYPIILRGSKQAISERNPSALYALACQQGWSDACRRRARSSDASVTIANRNPLDFADPLQ